LIALLKKTVPAISIVFFENFYQVQKILESCQAKEDLQKMPFDGFRTTGISLGILGNTVAVGAGCAELGEDPVWESFLRRHQQ